MHYLFLGLFDCYVSILRTNCSFVCLTVTLASCAVIVPLFVCLLRKYLVHYLFPGLFDCYVSISRTVCSLLRLTIALVSRALFFPLFV